MATKCYVVLYRFHIFDSDISINNTWGNPIGVAIGEENIDKIIEERLDQFRKKGELLSTANARSFKGPNSALYKNVRVKTGNHQVSDKIFIPGCHIFHVHNSHLRGTQKDV